MAGNVRELENVLRRAMIDRGGRWVQPQDLVLRPARVGCPVNVDAVSSGPSAEPSVASLNRVQREALVLAIEGGEVSRAALIARCDISRSAAQRALAGLVAAGLLRKSGAGHGARYIATAPGRQGLESRSPTSSLRTSADAD